MTCANRPAVTNSPGNRCEVHRPVKGRNQPRISADSRGSFIRIVITSGARDLLRHDRSQHCASHARRFSILKMALPVRRILREIRGVALISLPDMNRWGLYLAALFLLLTAWMWVLPKPGWAISILGLGAVVVAVRSTHKMPLWEEICWIVIAFALCGAEMRTLYADRADQEEVSAEARAAQTRNFLGIASGLSQALRQSQKQFAATMAESGKIFGTAKNNLEAVTGGNTFVEIDAVPNMGVGNPITYPLTVSINGKYVLPQLEMERAFVR